MATIVLWLYGLRQASYKYYEENINITLGDIIDKCKHGFATGGKSIKILKFTCKNGIKYGNLYDASNPYFDNNTTLIQYMKHYNFNGTEIDLGVNKLCVKNILYLIFHNKSKYFF